MSYPITFGRYLLLERVAIGGMAEVFKAKAFGVEGFERILAIKRILPNMADDDEFINMFVDEARIAVQLSHANIVQIYELGRVDTQYYIAMEYVFGRDLRQVLDRFRQRKQLLPLPAAAFLTSKICEGLDYAHRKGDPTGKPLNLIHRDVSPQNVLVSYEGAVKLTDFGIAKAEDRASKTQAGVLKGKFGYMSPEQVRGMEIDHRSDIFAVGILLYEMVTGKRLFLGESDFSTLEKVRNAHVEPPSQYNPDISSELERILLKSLAREREDRYQAASDLHDDLQQFLIEDNTIYNAKRLAAMLKEEYQAEIDADMLKMEEFVRLSAPPELVSMAASSSSAAESRAPAKQEFTSEKTVIFESGFADLADAPTQVADAQDVDVSTGVAPYGTMASRSASGPRRAEARGRSGVASGRRGGAAAGASTAPRHLGAIVVALAAFVSLLIVLIVLLSGGGKGTLIVYSAPVQAVDIFLDDEIIGRQTPLVRNDVPVGEHVLMARATGYAPQAFKFDLGSEKPVPVTFDLQLVGGGGGGSVEVLSDPPQALVRIDGTSRGETPVTVRDIDPSRPLTVELSKTGYLPQSTIITFDPGQLFKSVKLSLLPQPASGYTSPGYAPSGAPRGKVVVTSDPDGATVFVGKRKVCTTPCEVPDLDVGQMVEVSVVKDGYQRRDEEVRFASGATVAELYAELDESKRPGARGQPSPPRKARKGKGGENGGGGGGGGSCGGSGAQISVMASEPNCKVTVGSANLGIAPIFKKDAPVGRCAVVVECPSGKRHREVKMLKSGSVEKILLLKDSDWK